MTPRNLLSAAMAAALLAAPAAFALDAAEMKKTLEVIDDR
jgi:hypothetical protein